MAATAGRRKWAEGLAAAAGAVFLASAVLKAVAPVDFAVQVSYYGVVRAPWVVLAAAHATILLEALVGGLLVPASPWRRAAGWTALALLVGFTALIGYAWAFRGLEDCGCFGKFVRITPGWSIVKNGALAAMVAPVLLWGGDARRGGGGVRESSLSRRWGAVATAAAIAVSVGAVALAMTVRESGAARRDVVGRRSSQTAPAETSETGQVALAKKTGRLPSNRDPLRGRFETPNGSVDLTSGTHLVAMLSESCDHCAETVRRLNELTKNPDMPVLVGYVLGDADSLQRFCETNRPSFATRFLPPLEFLPLVGAAPPRLLLTHEGRRVAFWDGMPPEPVDILEALLDAQAAQVHRDPAARQQRSH